MVQSIFNDKKIRIEDIDEDSYGNPNLYRMSYDDIGEMIFYVSVDAISIERFYLKEEFRRRGIGRKFLEELENFARKIGVGYIESVTRIERDIVMALERLGFSGCTEEDNVGIEQLRMNVPIDDNFLVDAGIIMMCKDINYEIDIKELEIYATFKNAIENRPEILDFFIKNIDESNEKEILVKPEDVANELGLSKKFEDEEIYFGLRLIFFSKGLYVLTTRLKDTNHDLILAIRRRRSDMNDKLPKKLAQYL